LILVTGATGFVGNALCERLAGHRALRGSVRNKTAITLPFDVDVTEASLSPDQDWSVALSGVSSVIHCAARVHVMSDDAVDPLSEFRRVNVDGTLLLARQAAESGVRRFIFVSSIKVNGEHSLPDQPFMADQLPAPGDPYGVSKCEAEEWLRSLSRETGMEVVIIRPVLVYGPGVKANFLEMMRWLMRGIPLPLGGIGDNRRSLVYLGNLVDLIITCLDHPAAANQTFLVSDGRDLSTTDLLRCMAASMNRPARLIHVPAGMIRFGASLIGRSDIALRLCGSLQVDISKTRELLGWSPPFSVNEGLRRTAEAFLLQNGS
jgi:nucleoside-diphosphate-sugar epimerase